ncbi:MAG TPA: hypothetical protein VF212_17120 [Longimicrobiales bacterium]
MPLRTRAVRHRRALASLHACALAAGVALAAAPAAAQAPRPLRRLDVALVGGLTFEVPLRP